MQEGMSHLQWDVMNRQRGELRQRWSKFFGDIDVLLPATVPPVGRTAAGLPVGIQVVAPFLHDRTALAFARRITEVIGGYEVPPLALIP